MKLHKAETNFKSNFFIQLPMMMLTSIVIIIIQDFPWFLILITPIFIAPLLWGVSQIHKGVTYVISNENLCIQATFISRTIDISTIRKISKCSNFLATGIDRATAPGNKALEIWYNTYKTVKVSPKNESDFIADLLEVNPNIEVII